MPQVLRIALTDSLTYDGKNGGSVANFRFSKFKKLKELNGLGVRDCLLLLTETF
jgi:hypothetical protein